VTSSRTQKCSTDTNRCLYSSPSGLSRGNSLAGTVPAPGERTGDRNHTFSENYRVEGQLHDALLQPSPYHFLLTDWSSCTVSRTVLYSARRNTEQLDQAPCSLVVGSSVRHTTHQEGEDDSFGLCIILSEITVWFEECRVLGYKNAVRTSQETHYVSVTESSQLMLCKI
jgi:hypothetical protein